MEAHCEGMKTDKQSGNRYWRAARSTSWAFVAGGLLWLLSGCGGGDGHRHAGAESAAASSTLAAAVPGTPEAPRDVTVEVGDTMRFNVTRIEAVAGETIRLTLVNSGSASKEAMGHNWVLLKAGVDMTAYANAAVRARTTDYIPPERADEVIAHTRMLGGRSRDTVVFTLPEEPGEYGYVCTFPAHFQLGMKGVLVAR